MENHDKGQAVRSLIVGRFHMEADGTIIYMDGQTPPTEKAIQAEVDRIQAKYDEQEYARNREAEYPSIAELTVALYDTSDKSALVAKRAAVKAKYPKP